MKFALIAVLSILLVASASAQVVFDGNYIQDRRGYDTATSFQHDFQPYVTSGNSYYSPTGSFAIQPIFSETTARLPFVRLQQEQEFDFNQAFNQNNDFSENRDFNRDFQNIQQQTGRVDVNDVAGFSNSNTRDFGQFGTVSQNNVYSESQAPCMTRKVHYDVKGKRNDVRFTEEICNGYAFNRAGSNSVNYGYFDMGGVANNNFGRSSTAGFNEINLDFRDVSSDAYTLRNAASGSSSGSASRSGFLSNRFFDWLY